MYLLAVSTVLLAICMISHQHLVWLVRLLVIPRFRYISAG
jgi:hypothetical protein